MTESPPIRLGSEFACRIGEGPIPRTDAELAGALAGAVDRALEEVGASLPAPARERVLAGFAAHPDVARIALDLGGAVFRVEEPGDGADPDAAGFRPVVASRTESEVDRLALEADTLRIETLPVRIALDAHRLGVAWLVDTGGGLWLDLGERKLEGFSAEGEVEFDIDDARAMVRALAERLAKESSARVKRVDFDLEVERPLGGEQAVTMTGVLDGGYRFIGTRVDFSARVLIRTGTAVAIVEDVSLKASNPLAKFALLALRRRIRAVIGEPIDLVSKLPEGYRAEHLELRMRGRTLIATVRLA